MTKPEVAQMLESLIDGITHQSSSMHTHFISANEMLHNLPAIYKEYSEELGKEADELTSLERRQAVMNWTMRRYDEG